MKKLTFFPGSGGGGSQTTQIFKPGYQLDNVDDGAMLSSQIYVHGKYNGLRLLPSAPSRPRTVDGNAHSDSYDGHLKFC